MRLPPGSRVVLVLACAAALGAGATAAHADAPPVGPLPAGTAFTITLQAGREAVIVLPRPTAAGRVWRVARAFDGAVVREVTERDTPAGVEVRYRGVGAGTTTVVYALTRGETAKAFAARRYRFVVRGSVDCPAALALPADPIGPAVAAALAEERPADRHQAVAATVASRDPGRGAQVGRACGAVVRGRTVVVEVVARALLPSASLSEHVYAVSRTAGGWVAWLRLH